MTSNLRLAGQQHSSNPIKVRLTEAKLKSFACPPDLPRRVSYDTEAKGLTLVVTAKGARSWYWYARVKGISSPVRYHIGDADTIALHSARDVAREIGTNAARGIDPRAAREKRKADARAAVTIQQIWEAYRDQRLKPKGRPSTLRTDESRYNKHLSAWKSRVAQQITRDDVTKFHAELTVKKSENVADKTVKLLRRLFTFSRIDPNPARGVSLNGETSRDRFLTQAELQRLLVALAKPAVNTIIADAIRFALLTGARKGNVLSARWEDIHLDTGLWIIPADQSKNRKPMTIALAPVAIDLLKRRRDANLEAAKRRAKRNKTAIEQAAYVFPGRTPGTYVKEIKTTWAEVCKDAKINGVRFHDLRHTLASWMAMQGASLLLIGKQLGHASKASTARYSHLEVSAVRPAAEAAIGAMFGIKETPKD